MRAIPAVLLATGLLTVTAGVSTAAVAGSAASATAATGAAGFSWG